MIGYWILLLLTAFVAYNAGSISTLTIASVYVFHRDLHRIGKKRMFISNFRRLFGYKGFAKLLAVELVRDFIPLLIGAVLLAVNLYRYGQRVDRIVERLDTVSEQLEELDTKKLVQTANALSESLDPEKIEEIVTALDEVSKTLNEVDWASLSESLSEVAASAQERLDDAREALEKLDSVDLDSLNESIAKLKEVIEPLTKFLNPFG